MKIETLVCPNCGCREMGKVKISGNIGTCPACDETFVLELAEKLSTVEVDKTKDLQNFRAKLSNAIAINDVVGILNYSKKIIEIIPEDYTSVYFHAYAQNAFGNNNYLSLFYNDDIGEHTPEEMDRIIEHIINYSDLRDEHTVVSYFTKIDGIDNEAVIKRFKTVFTLRCQQEEAYDNIPRDVFICHRSTDSDIAQKICQAIEEDGNQCWISSRNLRTNDYENYWSNIEKAIKSCKIFLVVSSRDAMLSKDVKRELEIATELGKIRLECKIDTSNHTLLFKHFFDGITWIDLCDINENSLADLKYRVFITLNPQMVSTSYDPSDFNIEGNILVEYLGKKESVYIPDIVETIGESAFFGCKELKKIVLPRGTIKIGEAAFEGCSSLDTISFGGTEEEIGKRAFAECTNLSFVDIPKSVSWIREEAFRDCSKLKNIKIGDNSHFEGHIFSNTAYFNDSSNWEKGVLYLSNVLLKAENGSEGVCNIKEGVTQIAEWAFEDTYYDDIIFPSTLLWIGDNAINDCPNLETIKVPAQVRYIGESALSSCKCIEVDENNAFYSSNASVLFSKDGKRLICYPSFKEDTHYHIANGVEIIGKKAFDGSRNLEVVTYAESLTTIEDFAFSSCSLKRFSFDGFYGDDFPWEVSIGKFAFYSSGLKSLRIDRFKAIGRCAFEFCNDLTLYSTKDEDELDELIDTWDKEWNSKNQYTKQCHTVQWGYSPYYAHLNSDMIDDYEELAFANENYCKSKCEFNFNCFISNENCIKQAFREALLTLTPREEKVLRLEYGIEFEKHTYEQIAEKIGAFDFEDIVQIHKKALRKLRHPSRSQKLRDSSIRATLFSTGENDYFHLWCSIFGCKANEATREIELQSALEEERRKEQKRQEIEAFFAYKKKQQENITEKTTITNCCFGDRYGEGTLENELTVGELRLKCGDEIFKLCEYSKTTFEELVTVLHSKRILLGDYPPSTTLQAYFDSIYDRCKEGYINGVLSMTIEELDLSVRSFNCLKRVGIDTVNDLINKTEDDMIREVRNLGFKSLNEIKTKLASLGLSLKSDDK